MKYIIHCTKCEYVDEKNYITNSQCPVCYTPLIIEDNEEDDNIANDIEQKDNSITLDRDKIYEVGREYKNYTVEEILQIEAIENMEKSIKDLGHLRTWLAIESIVNPLCRVKMRLNFFKAGGRI